MTDRLNQTDEDNVTGVDNVNAVAHVPLAIPLSGTPANRNANVGDVLQWKSTHAGSSGLADPGGVVTVVHDASRWY